MLSDKLGFFIALSLALLYLACTNLELNGPHDRFYDNMKGNLHGFNDFIPANSSNFSFAAMGDTHIGSNGGGNLMVRALQMARNDGDSFAVIAGDDTNTGIESELITFNSQISSTGLTVYPAIGNHDIFFGGWGNYKRIIGRSIYSFNAGVVHFIFLDTANGTFGEDQLNWLRNDLQANTRALKVVVMHFPIYMGEFTTLYKLSSDEEATVFKSIMNQYGVNLVVSGHYHGFGDMTIGGTRYVVSGACNNILDIGNRAQYVKVLVNGSTISIRRISLD